MPNNFNPHEIDLNKRFGTYFSRSHIKIGQVQKEMPHTNLFRPPDAPKKFFICLSVIGSHQEDGTSWHTASTIDENISRQYHLQPCTGELTIKNVPLAASFWEGHLPYG